MPTVAGPLVAGVDGRRGGFALAVVDVGAGGVIDLATVPGQTTSGFGALLARCRDAGVVSIGVDAPIGLPAEQWRPVDLAAKARLGRGSSRVFLAPPREVLAEPTYTEARARCREVMHGSGLAAQTYGLRAGVLSIDAVLASSAWGREHVVEVHPELSFMAMAGRGPGDPLVGKRTEAGRRQRLDALAAAWSAHRWHAGTALMLGGEPDATGLPMRMAV